MKNPDVAANYSLPYTVKASWALAIIFSLLGLLISLLLLSIIRRGPSAVLPVIAILCIVWVFLILLLVLFTAQKIVLLENSIRSIVLFSRHEMLYSDITRVEVESVR